MRNGAEWYKREPVAFLGGVQGMTTRQIAVYTIMLDLIYEHGGSINNDPKWIAGWFSDMGSAAVRATISELIALGKLEFEGEKLTQRRAKNEAKTRQKLRENREKTGQKGGVSSGFSRSAARENSDLAEPKNGHLEKSRVEAAKAAVDAAPPSANDFTHRERLLIAMGVDPVSRISGPNGKILGTVTDMAEVAKWTAMGISEADQCRLVTERTAAMRARNPSFAVSRFAYFTGAMADLAAAKAAPVPTGTARGQSDRDAKLARYAKIAGGTP